jgi:allophanate hydrolase
MSQPIHLCDLAAIAVPAGFDNNGLPTGVTLIGPAWSEGRLAALADSVHRANVDRVGATRISLPAPDAIAADETPLFCIGAHMSGLQLNHQLTVLGGRFLRATRTAPRSRVKPGRCPPHPSARCLRRCRLRSVLAPCN